MPCKLSSRVFDMDVQQHPGQATDKRGSTTDPQKTAEHSSHDAPENEEQEHCRLPMCFWHKTDPTPIGEPPGRWWSHRKEPVCDSRNHLHRGLVLYPGSELCLGPR